MNIEYVVVNALTICADRPVGWTIPKSLLSYFTKLNESDTAVALSLAGMATLVAKATNTTITHEGNGREGWDLFPCLTAGYSNTASRPALVRALVGAGIVLDGSLGHPNDPCGYVPARERRAGAIVEKIFREFFGELELDVEKFAAEWCGGDEELALKFLNPAELYWREVAAMADTVTIQ